MIATAPTMIALATSVRAVIGSAASAQPRKTATTGLTKAYVETSAGGTFRSNQM
jgi:hypothetical protein